MTLTVDIAVEHEAWAALADLHACIERAAAAALRVAIADGGADVPAGTELSVVLCDDAFIRDLNQRWRGQDKATNVLSFPSADPAMLGDIVVAYETCAREADEEGRAPADHLAHMIVHGLFHLLGFDHEDEAEADAMEGAESAALAVLGIASPYAAAVMPVGATR